MLSQGVNSSLGLIGGKQGYHSLRRDCFQSEFLITESTACLLRICSDKKTIKWIWNGKVVHKLRASKHVVHFNVLCLCLCPILRSVSVCVSIVVFNDVIVLPFLSCCFLSNPNSFCFSLKGDGPKLVREMFRVAEEHAPSIVFIDEIDAVGTKR